jgi:serine/threonine protein phosphatase PrpC
VSATSVTELRARLDAAAERGECASLGREARIRIAITGLRAEAETGGGLYGHNPDNIALARVRCGTAETVLAVVCNGNPKDAACTVASGLAATAFLDAARAGLISDADAAPMLRRAMLAAHASIVDLVERDPSGFAANTAVGARHTLSGISTSVTAALVQPRALYLAHVGESAAVLVRNGTQRRLTFERAVLRLLGLGADPEIDVTRLPLVDGDVVLLGNDALRYALETTRDLPTEPGAAVDALRRAIDAAQAGSPATVVAVNVRQSG